LFEEFADGAYAITSRSVNKMEEMTMSSPRASGATSPTSGGQLEDAVTTFSDAVFEATQGLLKAQQELTRALLSSRAGQAQDETDDELAETDEADDELAETDETDETDDELAETDETDETDDELAETDETDDELAETDETDDELAETDETDDELAETDEADEAPPVQRRRPRPATGGRRTTSRAAN
jgi:hypothetical protein